MRTLVERMLPATFLVRHAIYMQTCAHIELVSWRIVQISQGYDHNDPEEVERFLKLKLNTGPIVTELKKCSGSCPSAIAIRVSAVADRIRDGIETRNLAAHGAWFFDDQADVLRVEHYWVRRSGSQKTWMHLDDKVSLRQIDSAIDEADRILRELVDIRITLEKRTKSGRDQGE